MQDIRSLEAQVTNASSTRERIDALNALAWAIQQQDTKRMESLSQQAYQLAQDTGYARGMAESLTNFGRVHYLRANFESAYQYTHQALEAYGEDEMLPGRAHALNTLGDTFRRLGDYAPALEHYQNQLVIATTLDDKRLQATALNGIGTVNGIMGNLDDGLVYLERGLALCQEVKDYDTAATLLQNISIAWRMKGDYDQARQSLQLSSEYGQKTGNIYLQIATEHNLSMLFKERQQYDVALSHLHRCIELAHQYGYKMWESSGLVDAGELYVLQQQYGEALDYLRRGLTLAAEIGQRRDVWTAHQYLAAIYKIQGDYKTALEHFEQYQKVYEEARSKENDQQFNQLEIRYRTQKVRQEADMQKRLREQEREHFEWLSEMKDEFLRTASHDLKNPLTSIALISDLLERHGAVNDAKGRDYLERIRTEIARMRNLITNLLDLARLETGLVVETHAGSLLSILQDMVDSHQLLALNRRITLMFEPPVQDYIIAFDTHQIQQVIGNLLSNAINYTPDGGRITVRTLPQPDEVVIQINDTGIGIPAEDIPHIFERFYRVRQGHKLNQEGTGLGLSIAKSIIEQHGGQIWVTSEPGKGSTFCFSLPYQPAAIG